MGPVGKQLVRLTLGLSLLAAGGCQVPPPSAYVPGGAGPSAGKNAPEQAALSVGTNTVGEACVQQGRPGGGADIFCGAWQQPSARIRPAGMASPDQLTTLATTGAWRADLDSRVSCEAATPETILGNAPALLMRCERRQGGWPHLALVAVVDGRAWRADGVVAALPAMERGIGVVSGRGGGQAATGSADLVARYAALAYSTDDIANYQDVRRKANRLNQAGRWVEAEKRYRDALALQAHDLPGGLENPYTATNLMAIGVQLSNQGRYVDADANFARAAQLVARTDDRALRGQLQLYRGLSELARGRAEPALADFRAAEQEFAPLLPAGALQSDAGGAFGSMPLYVNQEQESALLSLEESRRNQSVALRLLGRNEEADAAAHSADIFARHNHLRSEPLVEARLSRTAGLAASAVGRADDAAAMMTVSARGFARVEPRPLAETQLRQAELRIARGEVDDTLAACRSATATLLTLRETVSADLLQPCLRAYATVAAKDPAARQSLLSEMFVAAQLGLSGVTSTQIAQAAGRLAAGSKDPKAGAAIRAFQDQRLALETLQQQRDLLGDVSANPAAAVKAAELDKQLAAARPALAEADQAVQAASPGFPQLTQQVAKPADIFHVLRPGEVLVVTTVSETGGWIFALRDGQLDAAAIDGGMPRLGKLVARIRESIQGPDLQPQRYDTGAAQELYAATLGKVEQSLQGAQRLVVVPSGPLLSLPFGVLLTGPADADNLSEAPWLLRRFAITHVPSPGNFLALRKVAGTSHATRPWFGFGGYRPPTLAQAQRIFPPDSCGQTGRNLATLQQLPDADEQLSIVRDLLGGSPADQLVGAGFTASAVTRTSLQDVAVIHFSTHALLPAEVGTCQSEPAIVTTPPADMSRSDQMLLDPEQIIGMKLDAELVILSACNTGGPAGSSAGESLSGLARAFFFSGARALLVTHWEEDTRTSKVMIRVMLQEMLLHPDLDAAGALQRAQLFIVEHAGHNGALALYAHPFYWGSLALIGDSGVQVVRRRATAAVSRTDNAG